MIELDFCTVRRLDYNIIHAQYVDGAHLELDDAKKLIAAYEELAQGDKVFSLADVSGGKNMTLDSDAQQLMSREGKFIKEGNIIATGVVLNSLAIRMVARFFIRFHKPVYPMKIFSTKEEAIKWFKTFDLKKINGNKDKNQSLHL